VIDDTNPRAILEMSRAFQQSRALLTASELDVFTVLHDEWRTSTEVAEAISADPRGTDRLLNALAAIGLLHKNEGRFANSAAARRFLVRGRPDCVGNLQHAVNMWESWSTMTAAVRKGGAIDRPPIDDRGDEWLRPFIAAMHYRGRQQAADLVKRIDLSGVSRVLDIGGGSGAFSMAFVRAGTGISAVVFDLPRVAAIARNYIETEGFTGRITVEEGDYLVDDLPSGFDLALLSAVVHSNGPTENRQLIGKAAAAVDPGGRVVVVDWLMSEDRTQPVAGTFFALNMLVATDGGDTYTEAEVRDWLTGAGLGDLIRTDTPAGPGIISGRRPS